MMYQLMMLAALPLPLPRQHRLQRLHLLLHPRRLPLRQQRKNRLPLLHRQAHMAQWQ